MAAYQGTPKRREVNVLVIGCFSMIIAHIAQLHTTSARKVKKHRVIVWLQSSCV